MKKYGLLVLLFSPFFALSQISSHTSCEVLVIGGGTGGTAASIQSSRMGVKTILVESTHILGGMLTAAGVSCTDGNDLLAGGIWEEFRQALYKHYGTKKLNSGWVSNTNFEPHIGDSIFKDWTGREKNLQIIYGYQLDSVLFINDKVIGVRVRQINTKEIIEIKADITIDATETGDVMAAAFVPYDLGMDDPLVSGEKEAREKNSIIQDITWAAVLKDYGQGADKTINKPELYDPHNYYCCNSNAPCNEKSWNGDAMKMLNYGKLPRSPGEKQTKFMLNWPAHGNDTYLNAVEESYEVRVKNYELAKQHTLGFIYFIQTELGFKHIGLSDDELDHGLALIPYNREGRRLHGVVRMNINHIKDPYQFNLYRTGIASGNYPVDHHHAQFPGKVPELGFPPIPAFNIPMGVLIPEKMDGLLVCEKGISVTNIVNGTTRLQPVVLLTGQATGVLAALSVKSKLQPREISVRQVQQILLKAKSYLMPFTDVKITDSHWEAIQKAGLTGILRGIGKPDGWENKMLFNPDSLCTWPDLFRFYHRHPVQEVLEWPEYLLNETDIFYCRNLEDFFFLKLQEKKRYKRVNNNASIMQDKMKKIWNETFGRSYNRDVPITRSDFSFLLLKYFPDIFNHAVNLKGDL